MICFFPNIYSTYRIEYFNLHYIINNLINNIQMVKYLLSSENILAEE